ncbi:DUF11 domain-containing protein [Erythrobacter sp. SCSIO 43205]|uniref:hypothetical protein n=1 Tax=Erythrobacter sp. SCSIO 43205 TaxID=2779361 RepID=UPI001CA961B1|nr:hypothetical protein [Erythrobacter sp. SCSIO 43205]UAB76861.1 DUF11 domain-containing protein [Erythrobacter sp. SCSIO 43205]
MRQSTQLLGAVSAVALIAMSSTPAFAVGTTAGDTITNTVSVTYQVGDNPDTEQEVTDTDTFTVDRVVDVNVNLTSATPVTVAPGQVQAVLAFDVTNLSNDTVDLDLSTVLTAGTAANIDNITIYRDANGDGVLQQSEIDAGAITFLDEVAADDGTGAQTLEVIVVADITTDAVNGDTFDIVLIADAHEAGSAGTLGAEITATSGANTDGVDTVLADGSGTAEEAANQGDHSDLGQFSVAGALVSVVKSSRIVSDPVNGTTNPKAIPGAVIEYCIAVTNASGAAAATAVTVSDDLPADVTFTAGSGIFVDGTATVDTSGPTPVATCSGGSDGEGTTASFTAGGGTGGLDLISGDLSDIPASTTRSLYFEVTIN